MELMDLSNEILGLILENVGTENFTANVNRLLVCRRWYLLAQPVMLQVVWLTVYNLRRFTRVPDRMQELIEKGTQTISIDFFGFEEENMIELLEEDSVEFTEDGVKWGPQPTIEYYNRGTVFSQLAWYMSQARQHPGIKLDLTCNCEQELQFLYRAILQSRLNAFVDTLPSLKNIKRLSLEAHYQYVNIKHHFSRRNPGEPQGYLAELPLYRLIKSLPESLTYLSLDLHGQNEFPENHDFLDLSVHPDFRWRTAGDGFCRGLCWTLSPLLFKLKVLKIRMWHICEGIFGQLLDKIDLDSIHYKKGKGYLHRLNQLAYVDGPRQDNHYAVLGDRATPSIEEISINLSLSEPHDPVEAEIFKFKRDDNVSLTCLRRFSQRCDDDHLEFYPPEIPTTPGGPEVDENDCEWRLVKAAKLCVPWMPKIRTLNVYSGYDAVNVYSSYNIEGIHEEAEMALHPHVHDCITGEKMMLSPEENWEIATKTRCGRVLAPQSNAQSYGGLKLEEATWGMGGGTPEHLD